MIIKPIFKVILINILLLLLLICLIEIMLGKWYGYPLAESGASFSCPSTKFRKNYCPSIIHKKQMTKADGGDVILSYINKESIMVGSEKEIALNLNLQDYDVINLGDSFMQAEEMKFSKRLSAQMNSNSELRHIQVGFSSWAPHMYLNWLLSNRLKPGVNVNIFLFTNDFGPDGSADVAYRKISEKVLSTGEIIFRLENNKSHLSGNMSLYQKLSTRSFIISSINNIIKQFKGQPEPDGIRKPFKEETFSKYSENCQDLTAFLNVADRYGVLLKNYVEFSRPNNCWTEKTKNSVDYSMSIIQKIIKLAKARSINLHFYLIPAGWAFPEETMVGKGVEPYYYNIDENVYITQKGLGNYLKESITIFNQNDEDIFTDLEPVIRELKKNDDAKWYFPLDGHWTAHAHEKIAKFLLKLNK